jgi:murein DD-endopeptidase MepM/ murein hydrolase activator NlpD
MRKIKYYYNTHTLRFEKLERPLRVRLLQVFGFIAASIVTGIIIFAIAFQYVDSPKEKLLRQQNEDLKEGYAVIEERIKQLELKMGEITNRDNTVYRSIFEADPIADSARVKDMEQKKEVQLVQRMGSTNLLNTIIDQLNNLSLRIAYQEKSFTDLIEMVNNKAKLLAAIPAIQPISNKQLSRIASGFGFRIDPIYKTRKSHMGLDFAAPTGTPIYATSDGIIKFSGFSTSGFGNHVIINHGFGYETLYGHMVRVSATQGQQVKRGQVIGYVGSTGKSTGPHLHYEVHKSGVQLDPINFFYNDLTPAQFDRLLKMAAANNQSLD